MEQGQPILIGLKRAVEYAVIGANHGFLLLAQTPGDAEPRREVVLSVRNLCE